MNYHVLVLAILVVVLSCSEKPTPADLETDNARSQTIDHPQLNQAIKAAGGLPTWQKWRNLSFTKHTKLYDSTGSLERDLQQLITWERDPEKVQITWNDADNVSHEIIWQYGQVKKLEDGKVINSANAQSIRNSILSTTYVMSIPFKLVERGYEIQYKGIDTLASGKKMHVLQSKFANEDSSQVETDIWWHLYDIDTYQQWGYKVKHLDHISLVENTEMMRKGDILWPSKRSSWRINEGGDKLFLRATYAYSTYQIN